jgi:hypothetical protein
MGMSQEIVKECERILEAASRSGVVLRLIGGLAVRLHCPSACHRSLAREYPDIDFVGLKMQSKMIKKLFFDLGYHPAELFNALHGGERLLFFGKDGRRVDVFLDIFRMCHKLEFRDRLGIDNRTISLEDLLMTKLQIVELNEKDVKDIICLLNDHDVGDFNDKEVINIKYIADLCSHDWGLYTTTTENLQRILSAVDEYQITSNEKETVRLRINKLLNQIEKQPKSARWKLRSIIGKKKCWYELPEGRA